MYISKKIIPFIVITCSIIIGASSLYYTEILVKKLADREQHMINLYARGLKELSQTDDNKFIMFLLDEIIEENHSIPVILTDEKYNLISSKNIDFPEKASKEVIQKIVKNEIKEMKEEYKPIVIEYMGLKNYIFYKNSYLLRQLIYFPYLQTGVLSFFGFIAYLAFNFSRKAEQNKVWVGLAKETAHQLGTPISSLMAWIELMKADPELQAVALDELSKDTYRLQMITERFSNIGSVPKLNKMNILEIVNENIDYLKQRVSNKIIFEIVTEMPDDFEVLVNKPLFGWVIENICKNAIDAMEGDGKMKIYLTQEVHNKLIIDMIDTGKGMSKKQMKQVFEPGFTTKKRGWGLGLTLVKRIIENYHAGKIKVKETEIGKGTTFRIELNC